ncbi:uncharacterized protein LOC130082748 [Rhinichthys klamathensis goyatoka]|uniref:uncharacterized protein LOC130082748 n=1 Tax=Rhinichthys klamathensis goyatoka TaxID=3034132 RepID=UPI0024B62071|nr:uncharacterized protein LOC130082748 [Rhinichthys klamathensis goyatoka]
MCVYQWPPPGLSLQKQNGSNDSCILLLCSLEALNPELVNFTWIREGQGSLYSSTSYDMNSSLDLCKPDWSDGDTIICHANYSNSQTQTRIRLASHMLLTKIVGGRIAWTGSSSLRMCECRSVSQDEHIDNMYLKWVTNHLLFFTLIYLPHTDAESIRAVKGETVRLSCHSLPDDSVQVSVEWINSATSKTICKWKFDKKSESYTAMQCIPHVTFNRTSLSIENVQFSHSGIYSCKTTRLIPPPSVDNISNVKLQVEAPPGLSLQKQNGSNDSCILLLCSLEALNPELVNFTWIREGQGSLYSSTSYDMNSSLDLCKPDWSDGDTIICHANYSNNTTQTHIILTSDSESEYGSDKVLRRKYSAMLLTYEFAHGLF